MDASQLRLDESLLARDASKRKRVNRSAKLKQFKLDARREQWLSQGKQVAVAAASMSPTSVLPKDAGEDSDADSCVINHDDLGDLDGDLLLLSCNFASTVSKSSISCSSQKGDGCVAMLLDHASSGARNAKSTTKAKTKSTTKAKSKSKSKSRPSSCCSDKTAQEGGEEEEEDWEAAADALDSQMNLNSESKKESRAVPIRNSSDRNRDDRGGDAKMVQARYSPPAAWKVDDVFRPASLPRVVCPSSLPPLLPIPVPRPPGGAVAAAAAAAAAARRSPAWVTNRHRGFFGSPSVAAAAAAGPACCPICTEELDRTDSSFCPCPCGFRLCLFCHHRIAAEDGRCPGCRKAYKAEGAAALRPCTATS